MLKRFALTEWFHWQRNDGTEESMLMLTTQNLQWYCNKRSHHAGRHKAMKISMNITINGKQIFFHI